MMFDIFDAIHDAIEDFRQDTGARKSETMVVMSEWTLEQIKAANKPVLIKRANDQPDEIFGVEIVTRERIPDDAFGIFKRSCLDHIDNHIDELLGDEYEEELDVSFIPCDLCQHPLSDWMVVDQKITCPWCGDVNDFTI